MARYCVKCGRKLLEGAICPCRVKPVWPMGKTDRSQEKTNIPFWKILGIQDPEYDKGEDYFERGKQIVPDIVAPCEDEIPVKQYHIADLRARMQGLWAEGRLMITNKRVLFRASGRSFFGRTQVESEYSMEEIAGIHITRGIRFSGFDFFIALIVSVLTFAASRFLGQLGEGWILPAVLLLLGIVEMFFSPRRQYRLKVLGAGMTLGSAWQIWQIAVSERNEVFSGIFLILLAVFLGILIGFLVLASTKSVVSLSILCKTGNSEAIGLHSVQRFGLQWAPEILPAEDAEQAIKEIGAIISDIQERGDYGIDKWRTVQKESI